MGFELYDDEKRLIVDSNGMKRSVTDEIHDITWNEVILQIYDMSQVKNFNIFIGQKNGNTYLKVKERYNDSLFEQIFGFGCECRGWDINRTIKIE